MPQNALADAFLSRIAQLPAGPGVSLDAAVEASLIEEAKLRELFAEDKTNPLLADPYIGAINVFDAPEGIRTTRARVIRTPGDLDAHFVMPVTEGMRRKEGSPAMVGSLEDFERNFAMFTEGSLSLLTDWSNMIVAGGSVAACLAPLPDYAKKSKSALRRYFHRHAFPTSDIDIFLHGMTPEQAEAKLRTIYEVVSNAIPWEVTCVRTKNALSIHSQYPYRVIQIILKIYQSPAEAMAGYDIDASSCVYDGERVWATPRGVVAMMRQCNTVNMAKHSTSYESRLSKYASRGFEVYVPDLKRAEIDPTIFERSVLKIQGLARLLVLEKLTTVMDHERYLERRRKVRGRPEKPTAMRRLLKRRQDGDLKADLDLGLEMNDYDAVFLHIPYGPGWTAKRIEELIFNTDVMFNSKQYSRNKDIKLHRHPAFFGAVNECVEDCCECCPVPTNEEEEDLQVKQDETYVRGRVRFVTENPGRQRVAANFRPADNKEWAEPAYVGAMEALFQAIARGDRSAVADAVAKGIDVNRRDPIGRTPLQVAILSKSIDVACDLIDVGARMATTVVDGRNALHFAAQAGLHVVAKKLLDRSGVNAEKEKAKEAAAESEDKKPKSLVINDGDASTPDAEGELNDGVIADEDSDAPDVLEIDAVDWDYHFSALDYAVASGSPPVLEVLLAAGANPGLVTIPKHLASLEHIHPLALTATVEEEEKANRIAQMLIAAGAVTTGADDTLCTILHRVVAAGHPSLVSTFLKYDAKAMTVLNVPQLTYCETLFPIVTAVIRGSYAVLAVLLAHGASIVITRDEFQRGREMKTNNYNTPEKFLTTTWMPLEVSIFNQDEMARLLVALGAELNLPTKLSIQLADGAKSFHVTTLDHVRLLSSKVEVAKIPSNTFSRSFTSDSPPPTDQGPAWKTDLIRLVLEVENHPRKVDATTTSHTQSDSHLDEMKTYYDGLIDVMLMRQAQTGAEAFEASGSSVDRLQQICPCIEVTQCPSDSDSDYVWESDPEFYRHTLGSRPDLSVQYDELYAACATGDDAKIQRLCLPQPGHKPSKDLLPISVYWGQSNTGFTPLYLALRNKHWETAKLILAIACAQYSRKESTDNAAPGRFISIGDDSDDDSSPSDYEDIEEAKKEINLTDIANAPSGVRIDIPPSYMLDIQVPLIAKNGWAYRSRLIYNAIVDDDYETFVQLLELYCSMPDEKIPPSVIQFTIQCDRSELFDTCIRHTGQGIILDNATDSPEMKKDVYLGLNVHGKKSKAYLASADPFSPDDKTEALPLVWKAAQYGSSAVVRYLAGDRPLSALTHYAFTHDDAQAKALRGIPELATILPEKLGWTTSSFNETVVTAAVIGGHVEVLQELSFILGEEMQNMLQLRHSTLGISSLLAAVRYDSDIETFDFLLARGLSPLETDHNGWNMYHVLCAHDSEKALGLLKHALKHLPSDVTRSLLDQQSCLEKEAPLHIAVKAARVDLVELLINAGATQYLVRDARGSIPLHIATKEGRPNITRLLARSGPAEALSLEDGVGNTVVEIASRRAFLAKLSLACGPIAIPQIGWSWSIPYDQKPFDLAKHEAELPLFRSTLQTLVAEGQLTEGTKLASELFSFADHIESRIVQEKEAEAAKAKKATKVAFTITRDTGTASEVLEIVLTASAAQPTHRHLVPLCHVHETVETILQDIRMTLAEEKRARRVKDVELESQLNCNYDTFYTQSMMNDRL